MPKAVKKTQPASVQPPKPKKRGEREKIYPVIDVQKAYGDDAMTVTTAKQLLGWTEVTGDKYDFVDRNGKKIVCANNLGNRPFKISRALFVTDQVLRKFWEANGENMIIGETGLILSAQHRLIGLVFAGQIWEKNKDKYPQWETEPTLETLIVFGISEEDRVVNTIETGDPRTQSDVIFRSQIFEGMDKKDKQACARITSYAIRHLWYRTGGDRDALSPKRSHSELFEFIETHPTILKCVRHIFEEDSEKKISHYITPGTAAAMMYMMACSSTDPEEYRRMEFRNENKLDFSNYDKASEFWVKLAGGDSKYGQLRQALGNLLNEGEATPATRMAILSKAWLQVADEKPISATSLILKYVVDEDKIKHLAECPTVGGIDHGDPKDDDDADETVEPAAADPTPEEIAQRTANVRAEKRKKNGTKDPIKVGDTVWCVEEPVEVSFQGIVKEINGHVAKIQVTSKGAAKGKMEEAALSRLQHDEPEGVR